MPAVGDQQRGGGEDRDRGQFLAVREHIDDTVEDHARDIAAGGSRQAALAVLAGQFGERTAGLVRAVTNPAWEAGRDKHEQYRPHVAESLAAICGDPVPDLPPSCGGRE